MKEQNSEISGLWKYLTVVFIANLVQGIVVIPLLLKAKGLSPWRIAKGAGKALLVAFFTKSSNATLPVSLKAAKDELGVRPEVAHFTLPLCTVINMNGCVAFVFFSRSHLLGSHVCIGCRRKCRSTDGLLLFKQRFFDQHGRPIDNYGPNTSFLCPY
jgi:Na+/serine symporter